jgi:MOSC domain-containing protein YiiM
MKIVSTNLGNPQTIIWNGKEVQTGIYKYPVVEPIFLGNEDVKNDSVVDRKHHGGPDKACYMYPANHYSYWESFYPLPDKPWGMFGENLTVEGLYENEVCIGDIFQLGEATVQATQPRQPCYKLGVRFNDPNVVKRFVESGFPGVYVRVLKTGFVATGDDMKAIKRNNTISVQKVFELLYTSDFQKEELLKAIDNPYLAESCKRDLLKRWGEFL